MFKHTRIPRLYNMQSVQTRGKKIMGIFLMHKKRGNKMASLLLFQLRKDSVSFSMLLFTSSVRENCIRLVPGLEYIAALCMLMSKHCNSQSFGQIIRTNKIGSNDRTMLHAASF